MSPKLTKSGESPLPGRTGGSPFDGARALRQLVALAEAGNYRRAAERLGITHSALSQAISRMEEAAGAPLFARSGSGTVPTAFGRRLVQAARRALDEIDRAERDIALMRDLAAGRLVVGADPLVTLGLLAPALTGLMQAHPRVRVRVVTSNWRTMAEDLEARRIDFYLGFEPDRLPESLAVTPLRLAPPVVACRIGHPLTRRERVRFGDLVEYPLLGGDVPDWYHAAIAERFPGRFRSLDQLRAIFLVTDDLSLVREMLVDTDAVAIVPRALVAADAEAGRVALVALEDLAFDWPMRGVVARLNGYPLPPVAAELIRRIRAHARAAGGVAPR